MLAEKEINILKHFLVPEHTIMTPEEVKELLTTMKIRVEQLPKIVKKDPAVKAIDANEGDVLKITRKSQTAGLAVYYRLVVKG